MAAPAVFPDCSAASFESPALIQGHDIAALTRICVRGRQLGPLWASQIATGEIQVKDNPLRTEQDWKNHVEEARQPRWFKVKSAASVRPTRVDSFSDEHQQPGSSSQIQSVYRYHLEAR
ncbi:hypothetical protein NKH53_31135 [Mesorhizobium australicum]|uniref:hypothetical protein n=1 Tax=Mesorhizobium australicum TaxID=536018 RepID=UPI00333B17F3